MKNQLLVQSLFIFSFCFSTFLLVAKEGPNRNEIFSEAILYARIYQGVDQNTYPILSLDQKNFLTMDFDLNSTTRKSFYYTLTPCKSNWEDFELPITSFFSNYNQFQITQGEPSVLPTNNYVHYSVKISNYTIGFYKSGNYLVKVYETGTSSNPWFQKRIYVVREKVKVFLKSKVKMYDDPKQSVDISISSLPQNPNFISNLKVVLIQNNRYDRVVEMYKPSRNFNDSILFSNLNLNSFLGGKSWNVLDLSSASYQDINVVDYIGGVPHINLEPLSLYSNRSASSKHKGLCKNGLYNLFSFEDNDVNTQGKYYYVTFRLMNIKDAIPKKYAKQLYLIADFTDYLPKENYQLKYNKKLNIYECTVLLKQGIYSYDFARYQKNSKTFQNEEIFGSFVNTVNQYLSFCYYKDGYNSEEIVGYKVWTYR